MRYILTTTRRWKSFGPIEITVKMPAKGLVVIDPSPEKSTISEDGKTITFTTTVVNPDRNLRLAWVAKTEKPNTALREQIQFEDQADLQKLLEAPDLHPQAQNVLKYMLEVAKSQRRSP